MKKKYLIPFILLLLLGSVWHLLFMQPAIPEKSEYKIDLEAMQSMTANQKGLPVRLNSLVIAEGVFPAKTVVATKPITQANPMVFTSFQIVYPNAKTILIDTALNKSLYDKNFGNSPFDSPPFDEKNYQILQKAMLKADQIFITHEHMDHIGGIAQSQNIDKLLENTILTKAQINGPTIGDAKFPAGKLEQFKAHEFKGLYSPAPGIVIAQAPGHSTGTQMIFVHLQNNKQYLFIGDIAWHLDNIKLLIGRPWMISALFLKEDRSQVAHQLKALHELYKSNPELNLVIAHDKDEYQRQIQDGLYSNQFE